MSAHLAQLERAGLLRSWREQRRILYAVETEGIRQLVLFLTEDCCGGRPELCGYSLPAGACQGQERTTCAMPAGKEQKNEYTRLHCPLSLHRKLRAEYHGRGHLESSRTCQVPRL